jgi:hypothetical protein
LSHKKHDPNDLPSYVMMVKIISSFLKWLKWECDASKYFLLVD